MAQTSSSPTPSPEAATGRAAALHNLLRFLDQDPHNLALLTDAASAAIEAREPQTAARLLERAEALAPLAPAAANMRGLAALQAGEFEIAERLFGGLIAAGHDDPVVRFNLAWAKAMRGDPGGALELLDEATVGAGEQGPMLKVRMLHQLNRLDEALAAGDVLLAQYPADEALAGALSVVAMDHGDSQRAADYAARGPTSLDGLSTQGLLALSRHEPEAAIARFDRVLETQDDEPRAWLGKGLGRLSLGDASGASQDLERAAGLFQRHIGSWIAAGWAYFIAKDLRAARRCFETALALDDNFAESHGSVAVIDLAEGRVADARRGATTALRLDRQSFSGALAKSLLADHDQNPLLAQKIRERAMNVVIGADGQTIAKALVAMGLAPPRT